VMRSLVRAATVAAALAIALLAGCMVGPDYRRPQVEVPGEFAAPLPSEAALASVPADWWTLFNDATLNRLVGAALADNVDIRIAVARIEEANANLRVVNAAFIPEIDVDGVAHRGRPSVPGSGATGNALSLALTTSFELDFWGRLRRGAEAARALQLSARFSRDVVSLSLASLTTQTYFALRSLDAQIATTRVTLRTREDTLALVRRRADAGLSSDLEVNQAAGARFDAAAQLKELIRQRAVAQHQLGTLTGMLDVRIDEGSLADLPQPALPPPGLPSDLIERRPDIRQAEQDLVAANARIGIARAAMFPRISLTGQFGNASSALSGLFDPASRVWGIGLDLIGPVFDAGRNRALAEAEEARARQVLGGYEKTIQSSFREVSDALVNVESLAATQGDLQGSADAARNALRLATLRYESGYTGFLEVLDAQRTSNIAELAVIRNRQSLLSADVDLMRSLGGGWNPSPSTAGL